MNFQNTARRALVLGNKERVVFALAAVTWCAIAWLASGILATHRINLVVERELQTASATAHTIAANISQRINQVQSIPLVMSLDPSVMAVLMKFGSHGRPSLLNANERRDTWLAAPELNAMSQRLNRIRQELDLHTLFIVNAAGDCIAAGKPAELPIFIGVNYSDRQYFLSAKGNVAGSQFAVGRTDNVHALFYSVPVFHSDTFLGAVVARININNLTNLTLDNDTFITDENGVVILARDTNILMKALPGSAILESPTGDIENTYKKPVIEALGLIQAKRYGSNDVVEWKNRDSFFVYVQQDIEDEQLRVHVLRDLDEAQTISHDRIYLAALLSFAGIVLMLLLVGATSYVRSTSRHRQELLALNEALALQARTDELTGCANRRSFFETVEAERQRGLRYGFPLSILSLDIDFFKRINDNHGHFAGDQALCHFVKLVESSIRPTDRLGRTGGEEFGVVLPQTSVSDSFLIAERIRTAIEDSPVRFGETSIAFTVSIGVSQWRHAERESLEDFVGRSDNALYQAKNSGRNQVVVHE